MNLNRKNNHWIKRGLWICAAVLAVLITGRYLSRPSNSNEQSHTLSRQLFEVWIPLEGSIRSEKEVPVFSRISLPVTITELVPEGEAVATGDTVVTFDSEPIQQSLLIAQRDYQLAKAEFDKLREADIPTEIEEFEAKIADLTIKEAREKNIYDKTLDLSARELVSMTEAENQRMILVSIQQQLAKSKAQLERTRTIVHPTQMSKAEALLDAAASQLHLTREQMSNTVMRATIDGVAVYIPLHMDGEFRTVREGDSVYRNQTFLHLSDMNRLIVSCEVPESQISSVKVGDDAAINPTALPDVLLKGTVASIGSMAMSRNGKPAWQKFFSVTIKLADSDPRLRSSMSAIVQIRSFREENALVIPRRYVAWENGRAYTRIQRNGSMNVHPVSIGPGNTEWFLVTDGLKEGDTVAPPLP